MADIYADFLLGYIECALWSSYDDARDPSGTGLMLDANYDANDLTEECRAEMNRECREFIDANRADLDAYAEQRGYDPSQGSVWSYAGHDFWLTRNGHGAGFWDRGLGELGDRLADAARPYGECYLYVVADEIHCD